jgi:hypothetical protein
VRSSAKSTFVGFFARTPSRGRRAHHRSGRTASDISRGDRSGSWSLKEERAPSWRRVASSARRWRRSRFRPPESISADGASLIRDYSADYVEGDDCFR